MGVSKNIPFPWAFPQPGRDGFRDLTPRCETPVVAARSHCCPWGRADRATPRCPHPRAEAMAGQRPVPACPCGVWQSGKIVLFRERPQGPSSLLQPSVVAAFPSPLHVPARCPPCRLPSHPPVPSPAPLLSLTGCPRHLCCVLLWDPALRRGVRVLLATCRELSQVLWLDHCGAAGMCRDIAGLLGQRETGDTLSPLLLFFGFGIILPS